MKKNKKKDIIKLILIATFGALILRTVVNGLLLYYFDQTLEGYISKLISYIF